MLSLVVLSALLAAGAAQQVFPPGPASSQHVIHSVFPNQLTTLATSSVGERQILISGLNFPVEQPLTVTVGGVACLPVGTASQQSIPSSTDVLAHPSGQNITCVAPVLAAGEYPVLVALGTLTSNTLPLTYGRPVIDSISITALPMEGGPIIITGSRFAAGATVTVNGVPCRAPVAAATATDWQLTDGLQLTGVSTLATAHVVNTTQIACVAPPLYIPGSYNVVVTVGAAGASNSVQVTYGAQPSITGLNPNVLPNSGPYDIVVTGTRLSRGLRLVTQTGQSVIAAPSSTTCIVYNATTARCQVDTFSASNNNAGVAAGNSQRAVLGTPTSNNRAGLSYGTGTAAPVITSVTLPAGFTAVPTGGGIALTLTGTNLGTTLAAATTSVDIGGQACTPTAVSSSSVTCTAPALNVNSAQTLVLTFSNIRSNRMLVQYSKPIVTAVSTTGPTITAGGNANTGIPAFTITGNHFGPATGGGTISVLIYKLSGAGGGTQDNPGVTTAVAANEVTCTGVTRDTTNPNTQLNVAAGGCVLAAATTTTHSGSWAVRVSLNSQESDPRGLQTTLLVGTVVYKVSPLSIVTGTPVTILGSRLTGTTAIEIPAGTAQNAFNLAADANSITFTGNPAGNKGEQSIAFVGTTTAPLFVLLDSPAAAAYSALPSTGEVGTDTIWQPSGVAQQFSTTAAVNAGTLTNFKLIAGRAAGGGGVTASADVSGPVVSYVFPNRLVPFGGQTLTIKGYGFVSSCTVTVGTTTQATCTNVAFVDSSTLTCTTPTRAATGDALNANANVRVTCNSVTDQTVNVVYLQYGFTAADPGVAGPVTFSPTSLPLMGGQVNITFGSPWSPNLAVGAPGNNMISATTTITSLAPSVTINGLPCLNLQDLTNSLGWITGYTCLAPAQAATTTAATVQVILGSNTGLTVNHAGGSGQLAYVDTPDVSGANFFPAVVPGGSAGTTIEVISAAGVPAGAAVFLGSDCGTNGNPVAASATCALCTNVVVNNFGTSFTCQVPSFAASTSVNMRITTSTTTDAQSLTFANGNPAPVITRIDPPEGLPLAGGTITIIGTRLAVTGATPSITVGGNDGSCTPTVTTRNTTVLTCAAPARTAGPQNVVLTAGGASSAAVAINYGAPIVTSVSPPLVPRAGSSTAGPSIVISGARFTASATVTVGGSNCAVTATNIAADGRGTISCTAPPLTADGPASIVVTIGQLSSNTDVSVNYGAPTITSISPNQIPLAGAPIVITGTRFFQGATISVGTVACTPTWPTTAPAATPTTSTVMTCTPTAVTTAQTVQVTVTVGGVTSNSRPLTFGATPIISGIMPTTLPLGGGQVAISGAFLSAVTNVTIGGAACTPLSVVTGSSATASTGGTLICTAPPRFSSGPGQVQVQAFTSSSPVLSSGTLTITYGAPTITSVAPLTLPLGGGAINITATSVGVGSNLGNINATVSVTVGGVACTAVQSTVSGSIFPSATGLLSCVAPPLAAGSRQVVVTVGNETSTTQINVVYGTPNVTNIFPVNLPLPGGPIQIAGSFLGAGPVAVTVNGTNCQPLPPASSIVAYPNGSLIECIAPASTGTGAAIVLVRPVNVNNNDTNSNTTTVAFDTLPIITAVTPNILPLAGGQIVISGFRFLSTANVTVGGQLCTNIQLSSPVRRTNAVGSLALSVTQNTTELTCIAPPIRAGGNQLVIVGQGTSNSVGFAITYQSPIVNQLLPVSMPSSGGLINITGTAFGALNLPVSITVNGTACTNPNPNPAAPATNTLIIATANSTNVQCVAPSLGNGTFPVVVSVNAATPNLTESSAPRFLTYGLPVVVAVGPSSIPLGGTTINVTATNVGLGLVSGQPSDRAISVAVNGQPCTAVPPANAILSGVNGTDLRCVAPALRQNGSFALTVSVGALTSVGLNVTYAAPQIASITPVTLPNSGDIITLAGNFFGTTAVAVTVGGQACRPLANATAIIPNNLGTSVSCIAPARTAGNAAVTIQVSGDTSNALNVTYVVPNIAAVAPVLLPLPGGDITLSGTFFGNAAVSVTVNGTACLPTGNNTILVPSNNAVRCRAPQRAYGTYTVVMSTVTGDLSNTISVTYAPPTIASLVPASLPSAGGDFILIGTSLGSLALNVTVGGISASPVAPATAIVSDDGVSARVRVLSRSPGVYPVTVTIGDVSNAVNLALAPPSIASITPAAVNASVATTITLNGTSFGSGFAPVTVTINGTACAPVPPATAIIPVNGTRLSCVAPALPAGSYPVVVRVVNETSSPVSLLYRVPTVNDTSVATIVMRLTTGSPAATAANPAVAATINSAIAANLTNSNITVLAIITNTTVATSRRSLLQSGVLATTAITYPIAQASAFSAANSRIAAALASGNLAGFFDPASIAILNAAGVTGATVVTSTVLPPSTPIEDDDDDDRALRLGLGIGLGIGIPVLIAIVAVIIIMRRKKQAVAPPA